VGAWDLGESVSIRYQGSPVHTLRGSAGEALRTATGKVRLGQCFEKFGRFYSECVGQRDDVYDRYIPFPPLDSTYVVAMQIR